MGRNYVKTFTKDTKGYKNLKLPKGNNPGTPQSMAVLDDGTVVVVHNKSNNDALAHLRKYTKNGYVSNSDVANNNLGHCNGATYCDKNGYIYCTGYTKAGSRLNRIVVLNKNLKQIFSFDLPVAISGIAYDRTVDKFYCTKGNHMYVFPYSAFTQNNRTKTYKRYAAISDGRSQDCGGYNGIIYNVCYYSSWAAIDMYRHTDGKYVGSIKISYSETESCGFDNGGNFIYMTANQQRALHWTTWVPQYKAGNPTSSTSSSSGSNVSVVQKKANAAEAFVKTALGEVGTKESPKGSDHVKYSTWYSGKNAPWCSEFVLWCAWKTFGDSYKNFFKRSAAAHYVQTGVVEKGGSWILNGSFAKNAASAAKCRPGDIFTTDKDHDGIANHIGIIEKVSGTTIYTVEGNHGDKVAKDKRSISNIFRVARPNWPGGEYGYAEEVYGEVYGDPVLEVHPEQLYSSNNYQYIDTTKEETEEQKRLKAAQQSLKDFFANINVSVTDPVVPDIQLPSIRGASNVKKPQTKFEGDISGSALPATVNYVEAPYAKITLGGVSIGTYKQGSYPNYVTGLSVKKTNGSLNEYTINLIHQIAAGDNPNYIDNLISANGYNKIQIEYGDAQAGIAYRDINALLIDVKSKFDFFNNCISYTLSATSSSAMSAVNRRNYASVTDKPSNIITNMLYETGELLDYFPAMKSRDFVNSNNLIPSDDIEVAIDAVTNTTPLNYMNKLVSSMKSNSGDYIYYLNINDEDNLGSYFNIQQVKTKMTTSMFPLVYEVDINYPDENSLIYNFSVNTDYTWPLAYEYGGSFPSYDYNILNNGNLIARQSGGNVKSTRVTDNRFLTDKNWWTNVTEFPVTATLETKGLTSYLLLLNYIKVNVFYFGNKRDSSGIYIVTGQEDSLSGNGFRTKLDLLRVAGDGQYLTVDGRVVS